MSLIILNNRILQILFSVSISCVLLLTSCGGITPIPETSQTKTFIPTITATNIPDISTPIETEIIEPETVYKLEIVDKWGQGNVYGVALSPDKKTIAAATATGIYLYDSKTLQQKQFIDRPIVIKTQDYYFPSQAISFSPDGKLLGAVYDDGIQLWNLSTYKHEGWIDNRIAGYQSVQIAFAPQNNAIAVMSKGSYTPCDASGGNFALYDIKTQDLLYNDYFCPESALFHFGFMDDGNVFFVGIPGDSSSLHRNYNYRASFVNSMTGDLLKKFDFDGRINSVSPNGTKISVSQGNNTEIVDTTTLKVIDQVAGIVIFLPDNERQMVAAEKSWTISTNDHKIICKFENPPQVQLNVYRSTFTLQGNNLIFWDSWNQNLEIWDTSSCKLSKQLFLPIGRESLEYSNDGNFLAINSMQYIHILDGNTGNYRFSIPGSYNAWPRQYYDFSEDSKILVVVSFTDPYTISFWDLVSNKEIQSISTNFEYVYNVSLSPDGAFVATDDHDGIHLWDVKNHALLNTISGKFPFIDFSPNRDYFAFRDENDIIFRDTKSGNFIKKISVPEHSDVVFSKDWKYMVIDEYDKNKKELWDTNGTKIREFSEYHPTSFNLGTRMVHYETLFTDITFSPDNNLLVAISSDPNLDIYSIHFWDTRTGAVIRDLIVPFRISELEFSTNGKKLTFLGNGIIYTLGIKKTE